MNDDKTCPCCGAPIIKTTSNDYTYECGALLDLHMGDLASPCPVAEEGMPAPRQGLRVIRGGVDTPT